MMENRGRKKNSVLINFGDPQLAHHKKRGRNPPHSEEVLGKKKGEKGRRNDAKIWLSLWGGKKGGKRKTKRVQLKSDH